MCDGSRGRLGGRTLQEARSDLGCSTFLLASSLMTRCRDRVTSHTSCNSRTWLLSLPIDDFTRLPRTGTRSVPPRCGASLVRRAMPRQTSSPTRRTQPDIRALSSGRATKNPRLSAGVSADLSRRRGRFSPRLILSSCSSGDATPRADDTSYTYITLSFRPRRAASPRNLGEVLQRVRGKISVLGGVSGNNLHSGLVPAASDGVAAQGGFRPM